MNLKNQKNSITKTQASSTKKYFVIIIMFSISDRLTNDEKQHLKSLAKYYIQHGDDDIEVKVTRL